MVKQIKMMLYSWSFLINFITMKITPGWLWSTPNSTLMIRLPRMLDHLWAHSIVEICLEALQQFLESCKVSAYNKGNSMMFWFDISVDSTMKIQIPLASLSPSQSAQSNSFWIMRWIDRIFSPLPLPHLAASQLLIIQAKSWDYTQSMTLGHTNGEQRNIAVKDLIVSWLALRQHPLSSDGYGPPAIWGLTNSFSGSSLGTDWT